MSGCCEKMIGPSPPVNDGVPKKILCVGTLCLDIVQTCRQFPSEDSVVRSEDYRWQRGGNASNTCTVLSLLGQPCELLARLSKDEHGSFLQSDLRKCKIACYHCPLMSKDFGCPISTVILSLCTGTRTIIHHKANLPDLTFQDFEALNLEEYSWIHFEGRNLDQVLLMIQRVQNYNNSLKDAHIENMRHRMPITISVELERSRSELLDLLSYADVAFVAKDFARSQGFNNMNEIIKNIDRDTRTDAIIICAWAERGAMARTVDGEVVQSPAFPPQEVIDTLGAGDTFNAAVLYYLNKCKAKFINKCEKEEAACMKSTDQRRSESDDGVIVKLDIKQNFDIESFEYGRKKFIDKTVLQEAVTFGCHIAGAKVGVQGYDGLDKICIDVLLDSSTD